MTAAGRVSGRDFEAGVPRAPTLERTDFPSFVAPLTLPFPPKGEREYFKNQRVAVALSATISVQREGLGGVHLRLRGFACVTSVPRGHGEPRDQVLRRQLRRVG